MYARMRCDMDVGSILIPVYYSVHSSLFMCLSCFCFLFLVSSCDFNICFSILFYTSLAVTQIFRDARHFQPLLIPPTRHSDRPLFWFLLFAACGLDSFVIDIFLGFLALRLSTRPCSHISLLRCSIATSDLCIRSLSKLLPTVCSLHCILQPNRS